QGVLRACVCVHLTDRLPGMQNTLSSPGQRMEVQGGPELQREDYAGGVWRFRQIQGDLL
ncbi:hypothetical protein P8F35_004733, partial [Salmonella enterica]|nr:hypothetical protein [Salmonella enterica]EHD6213805.1 hypothetical protein [Salmonella enterica]EIG1140386.1 hypothetical protein [Salmonella enterica]EJK2667058.1 hypothetical protein [Salmonella enterica]EKR2798594.1 hypothetical protein [Salmonella enterica]